MPTRRCYLDEYVYWSNSRGGDVLPSHGTPVSLAIAVEYRYASDGSGGLRLVRGGPYPNIPPVRTDENGRVFWDLQISDEATPRIEYRLGFEGVAEEFVVPPESEFAGDAGTGDCSIVDLINQGLTPGRSTRPVNDSSVVKWYQTTAPPTTGADGSEWFDTTNRPWDFYVLFGGVWIPVAGSGTTTPLSDTPPLGPAAVATAGTAATAMRSDARPAWLAPDWTAASGAYRAIENKPVLAPVRSVESTSAALSALTELVISLTDQETGVADTNVTTQANRYFQYLNSSGYAVEDGEFYVLQIKNWNPRIVSGADLHDLAPASPTRAPAVGNHVEYHLSSDGISWPATASIGLDVDDRPMVSFSDSENYEEVKLVKLSAMAPSGPVADPSGLDSAVALPAVADHSHGDLYLVGDILYQLDATSTNLISGVTEIRGRNPARVGVGDFEWGQDYYSVLVPQSAFAGAAAAQIAGQFVSKGPTDPNFTADLAFMRNSSLDEGAKYGYSIRTGSGSLIEPNIGAGDRAEVRLYLDDARTMPLVIRSTAQWKHYHSSDSYPTPVRSDWTETDAASLAYIQNKPTIPAAQVQSDWEQSDSAAVDYIENKPTIPAAQVQSDWEQSNSAAVDYIENKPTIPAAQVQSDWTETDANSLAFIENKPPLPDAPLTSLGDKIASSAALPTESTARNINAVWTLDLSVGGYFVSGNSVRIPALPRNPAINGLWIRAYVGGVEVDRSFMPWGPGSVEDQVRSGGFERGASILILSSSVWIAAQYFMSGSATNIVITGRSQALPADTTIEIWEAISGRVEGTGATDHNIYEATAPISAASPAQDTGDERTFTLGAATVDPGMGIAIANNRITVDAGTPERLYEIGYDIELDMTDWVNTEGSGGNRMFFDLYVKKNGAVDESTRRTHFAWYGSWAPDLWNLGGMLTERLSAGDYLTLHMQRTGAVNDGGSEVRAWSVSAANSSIKIDTQAVSGGGGSGGDYNKPAADLSYTLKLIAFEEIPALAAPATTTFAAVGSGATLYYRSTNPFGTSAGLVYLDYYPTSFGGGGQLAGTYVASTNLNVAQTDRVPDILRVVTRDYKFTPLGVPSSTVALFQTPRVAATDRVTASDLTKTMDVRELSQKWKRGSAPTTAQRTLDKDALRMIVGEPIATAAIAADANTPAGTRFRLTHEQTIKGHGLLTPGDNTAGSKVGWIAGSVGTLRDADGSANTGSRTSGAPPRASEIVSEPARHVSSVLSASAAPTPAWVVVDGIRYQTTAEAVSGSNQVFEFSDGTRFIEGVTYAVNIEWSDGTFEWPDRVLQPGLYEWDGHRIIGDPDNISTASLAPYVKAPALAGGGRFGLADLPIYVVTAAPSGDDPAGIYLTVA